MLLINMVKCRHLLGHLVLMEVHGKGLLNNILVEVEKTQDT